MYITVNSRYLKVEVHLKLLISQSKFAISSKGKNLLLWKQILFIEKISFMEFFFLLLFREATGSHKSYSLGKNEGKHIS